MTIELSKEAIQFIQSCCDLALKQGGLTNLGAVNKFLVEFQPQAEKAEAKSDKPALKAVES